MVKQFLELSNLPSTNMRSITKQQLGFLVSIIMGTSFYSCSSAKIISPIDAKNAILSVMDMQERAWSDGDIHQFMEGYWKSEKLSFVGKSGINKGWETTLNNYLKGYPTKEVMGKLTFEVLELNRISNHSYHMIGRFTLIREVDKPTGLFTLIWKYIDHQWVIVSDHTSG